MVLSPCFYKRKDLDKVNDSALTREMEHVDMSQVSLGSTSDHEPIVVKKPLWARRNSPEATQNNPKNNVMTL